MTTTRRALILGLVLAILLAGAVGLMLGRRQVPRTSAPEASSVSVLASPRWTASSVASSSPITSERGVPTESTPHSNADETKAHWESTVEGFARYFTKTRGSQRAWVNRLQPFVTEEVRQYLEAVDIANIPAGRYGEYEVLQAGESQMAVRITYREGWSMVLYLVNDGTNWRVARYDRFEE